MRLFLPSIVLLLWAGLWAAGVRGDAVIAGGLVLTAGAVFAAELERRRLRALLAGGAAPEAPQDAREVIRDVVLIAVSALSVWSAVETQKLVDDLAVTRETAIRDSCEDDQAQDNVLRALIGASLDNPDPNDSLTPEEARELSEELLRPLGGLEPTEEELDARCDHRVIRGSPPP